MEARNPTSKRWTVGLSVTLEERRAVMLVAQTRGLTGHSAILRTMSLDQVMVEYHRLFELFSQEAA